MQAYDVDFFAWTQAQAAALRAARPNNLDWANIAEELEAIGRSEWSELERRVRQILMHLLKWRYQSWMRTRSWRNTLRVQRHDLKKHLQRNPSLRPQVQRIITQEYSAAVWEAYNETGLADGTLPDTCPFGPDEVLDQDLLPDGAERALSPGGP
jgi:hypothetical protein